MYVLLRGVAVVIVGTIGLTLVVIVGNEHPMSRRIITGTTGRDTKETW
jgi:hypothetical protein